MEKRIFMEKRRQYLLSFATDTIAKLLRRRQLSFLLCGDLARAKYATTSFVPSKVEIIIISGDTVLGDLKRSIIQEQPIHFSLRETGTLRFRDYSSPLPRGGQRAIDVDLAISREIHSLTRFPVIDGFGLVPYSYVLLCNLEDWDKVRESTDELLKGREKMLSRVIDSMLKTYSDQRHVLPGDPFDSVLELASVERVARFSATYPRTIHDWKRLGFVQATSSDTHAPARASFKTSNSDIKIQPKPNIPSTPIPNPSTSGAHQHPAVTAPSMPNPPVAATKRQKRKPRISRTQIRNVAAKTTVAVLRELGVPCAIFGSMGCRMFGNSRPPNDVDVLLLPPPENASTQEDLKAAMVARDPVHFFLKNAKDPEATYKVLYYRMEASSKDTSKVDILLPGVMHLPALPLDKIVWQWRGENVLPVVPFSVLLLQKLQGWDDHRKASEKRYIDKAPIDVSDLRQMLQMRHVQPLTISQPWSDRRLFSEEFEQLSRERVLDFCAEFPEHGEIWERLGFETEVLRLGYLRLGV